MKTKKTPNFEIEDFLIYLLLDVHQSVVYHQKLIDKWNNPKDTMVRAAVVIRDIHAMYGRMLFFMLNNIKKSKVTKKGKLK